MSSSTAQRKPEANRSDGSRRFSNDVREQFARISSEQNPDVLRRDVIRLFQERMHGEQQVQELSTLLAELKSRFDLVMAPEHHVVVITNVERNGSLVVEVAGTNNARTYVVVAPEVDPATLQVGVVGLVTRERNCLVKAKPFAGSWQDIGTFERYIEEPNRILLTDRETLVAVDTAAQLRETHLTKGDLIGFDRNVGLAYRRLDTPRSDHLFDEHVTDEFSQLGGLDSIISRIKQHIGFRLRHRKTAEKYGLRSKCGILLWGLPGNGKTRIARCCAAYVRQLFPDCPCRFMHVSGSSEYSKWLGESEHKIVDRFRAIREAAKDGMVVVFWDEVDAIARQRGTDNGSGAPDRILSTFLSQIDGVVPLNNVILLFATNRPDTLDPGFLRPGRVDEKIELPSPNRRAAEAILERYLASDRPLATGHTAQSLGKSLASRIFAPNGDYAVVAQVKLSDGRQLPVAGHQLLSGAMLECAVLKAAHEAAVREVEMGFDGLTEDDVAQAIHTEFATAVSLLTPSNIKSYVRSIPQQSQPIAVERVLSSPTKFVRSR